MPARNPLVIGPFSRGLNTYDDPTAVLDDELVEALNWDPGLEGSLKSRPPFQNLGNSLPLGATGNARIIGVYYATNGEAHLIASDGLSSTYAYASGTWTLITNTFAASSMAQFDGKAWLTSPVGEADPGGYWTPGGGFTADSDMPHGDVIVSYKFRLWIAPGKNSTNGTRVYYSKVLGQPNFWQSAAFVDIGAGDGQSVVALTTYYNSLLVFRTQSIYAFEYVTDPGQGTVQVIVPGVGLENKHTLVSHENYLYFMYDEKAYEFINNRAVQINIKVPFSAVNKTDIAFPFTVSTFNNRVIFGYYDTMYVFSLRTRTWTRWRSPVYGAIGQFVSPVSAGTIDEAYVLPSKEVPVSSIRRNLHPNPSLDVDASGYSPSGSGITVSRAATGGVDGGPRGNSTVSSLNTVAVYGPTIPVSPGQVLTVSYYFRTSPGSDMSGRTARTRVTWLDGGGGNVVATALALTTAYQRSSVTVTVPPGVTQMRPDILVNSHSSLTGSLFWDMGMVEESSTLNPYFDGNTPSNDEYTNSWDGTPGLSTSTQTGNRVIPLLYITDGVANVAEEFECVLQTKNYNYKLSSNFKRLYWWGVDAIFRRRVIAQAVPVSFNRKPTWGELVAQGITWGTLLSGTWGNLYSGDVSIVSDYDLEGLGSIRKFVKFRKGLRFRQIYFRLRFETDGSIASAPVQVFSLSAYVDSKETVSKTVS